MEPGKFFCDPIHGMIQLHPLCVNIIDTPQFQRLRNVKQLGLLEFVYPGATHNRFEHSLGVAYLGGKFLRRLKDHQLDLNITEKEILCIEIAGLCHDLGHGPFSHLWEKFMNMQDINHNVDSYWKHEKVSVAMFDYLVKENNLIPKFQKWGLNDNDIMFIKDLILGSKEKLTDNRAFLYQIINNEESGLDVDKWDYFLRDSYYLGMKCDFDSERLMCFAAVLEIQGQRKICFRDKLVNNIYNMFRTRYCLHQKAYQHRVNVLLETIFCDALIKADGKVIGPHGKPLHFWKMSNAVLNNDGTDTFKEDAQNYSMLIDPLIICCLKYSVSDDLKDARDLLQGIDKRDIFYKNVVTKVFLPSDVLYQENEISVLDGIAKHLPAVNEEERKEQKHRESMPCVVKDDVLVKIVSIHWGKKKENPVDAVNFYSKNSPLKATTMDPNAITNMIPKSFMELHMHVISKRPDNFAELVVQKSFNRYYKEITTT